MQNFKTSRFEFTPQFVPSEEIDSPLAVSSRNPSLSKSSDRAYPRRDELFQDENGNLYLYKVINGVHKYVKISADGTSGSDNGDVVNIDVYLPYERLAKLSATGINSAVFEDGTIATVENSSLKFYKHNVTTRELEQVSTISLDNDVAEYFQHKFVGFTYATGDSSFRILIGYKITGDYNPTIAIHAFRLISNLSSIDTTYKLEPFGPVYSWSAGQVTSSCSIHMLRDDEDSIRLFVYNAIIEADITNSTIAYDTIDTLVYKAISGNSNAVLIQKYRDSGLYLYMRGDDVVINMNDGINNDTHKLAILNVKRENTRPGYTGMYGVVSAFNHSPSEANPTNSSVYTTDFDANNPVKTDFSINLGANETIVKVIDNTPILNHSNIQNGYEKMVMSFVVISKLVSKYNAYLYYVVPESAVVHNSGTDANEPYEDSKYSVLCVGKYQFSGSEEITNIESDSYLYYLDNENILENRSNSIAIYAASQFKYLAASFADSLFAASLQAINAEIEYAKAKLIKNDEMISNHIYADEITAKKSSLEEIKSNSIDINPKANHQTAEMDEYDILDDDGNKALNLYAPLSDTIKQGDSRSVLYKNYIIHLGLGLQNGSIVQKVLYVFDVESNKQYKINYEWGNSDLDAIPAEDNQGRICININKYGNLYGTVCCRNAMYNFYLADSIDDIIRKGNSVTFIVEEDTSVDPDNNFSVDTFKTSAYYYFSVRTDTSIIYVLMTQKIVLREVSLELSRREMTVNNVSIYDTNYNGIVNNTLSFNTYYKYIELNNIRSGLAKLSSYPNIYDSNLSFDGLYYNDYVFIPLLMYFGASSKNYLTIIRSSAPHVKEAGASLIEYRSSTVKQNDIYYTCLDLVNGKDANGLPMVAISENCVRYIDENGNRVDAYFKGGLGEADVTYKDVSLTYKPTDNVNIATKHYLVHNHRLYEYHARHNYSLILREVNAIENNFEGLVITPDTSADANSAVYILGKYLLYTYKDHIDNKYKLCRKYNRYFNISATSIAASNADIANINTGKIQAEKAVVENLKISDLNISTKTGITAYNGLTANDKQVIIDSANGYLRSLSKYTSISSVPGQQTRLMINPNAFSVETFGNTELFHSLLRYNFSMPYGLYASISRDSGAYYLSLNFVIKGDHDYHDSTELDMINYGLGHIKLYPKYLPDVIIDADYFTRITDTSKYDYQHFNDYYVTIPTGAIGTNNIYNQFVYNSTTHNTEISFTAPDGTDIKTSIRLGCVNDSTGNVYIFFDTIKILGKDVLLTDNPIVLQITTNNNWKVFNAEHYSENRVSIYNAPYPRLKYYEICTNPNYINETFIDEKKIVYFPTLIKAETNIYTAINNGVMFGIVNNNSYDSITWNFVNLGNVPNDKPNNPLDAYINSAAASSFSRSLTDIDIKNIPYITTTDRYKVGNTIYFRVAVNTVKSPDTLPADKISMVQPQDGFTMGGDYGAYKCTCIFENGGSYNCLQYQYTAILGFTYNTNTQTFKFTRGSKIVTPEMTLVSSKIEHTELLSSAQFVPNGDGVVFTNHLGPVPELNEFFKDDIYEYYATNCYKPTYYSNMGFNANAEWNSTSVTFPIYYSNNFFRTSIDSSCANYPLNSNTFLTSTWINDYMTDNLGNIANAYKLLTLSVSAIHSDSNRLDLVKMLGMVNDSTSSIRPADFVIYNLMHKVRGIPSGYPDIKLYSPLPKDLTFIPSEDVAHAYTLLFSIETYGLYSSSYRTGFFLSGCIFLADADPRVSIPVTSVSSLSRKWLDNELQYNGSSRIYNAFNVNQYYLNAFKGIWLSSTHGQAMGDYGNSDIIDDDSSGSKSYMVSYNQLLPKTIKLGNKYYRLIPILSSNGSSLFTENIYSASYMGKAIPDSVIIDDTTANYAELAHENNYCILTDSNATSYFYVTTLNKVYAFKDGDIYNMHEYSIDNAEFVNSNYMRITQVNDTKVSTPDYYEGNDIRITYPTISISYIEDNEPLDSIYAAMESSLFVNGKRVVLAKE